MKKLVIDGNDGTGKTTLVKSLRDIGYVVSDRGIPSLMTDGHSICIKEDELYIILDTSVEVSQERLSVAGKNLTEQYHTVEDLTFYRKRFKDVAEQLGSNCIVVDATNNAKSVLRNVLNELKKYRL